jgi:F-type H+-transporting ATPase subunit delta
MPRQSEAVAKSYAKALFALARERNQVEAVGKALDAVANVVTQQPALLAFLSRPWVAVAAKRGAAMETAARLGLSSLTRDFLSLVAARNRADHVPAIAAAYRALDDEARGRVRVKLRTAIALTDAERETLSARLSRMLGGKTLAIEESVDPSLLGGFVAEVGSMILDGSLDTQLDRMRDRLARA